MPLHAGEHRAVGPRPRPRPTGVHRTGARGPGPVRRRPAHRGGAVRRRFRLYGLAGVLVGAVALPLAAASAGPAGPSAELSARQGPGPADPVPATPSARPLLPPGPALALRCGPELTSPEGIEAQTCVLTRGAETWARAYYRNATGGPLDAALSLIAPDGRSVRTHCALGAEDAPGTCQTPAEPTRGAATGYTAIAEFAGRAGYGPLLLRAGSNDGASGEGGESGGGVPGR